MRINYSQLVLQKCPIFAMSRYRKNVKIGTKQANFFQKIAKYLKKARENRKKS